ncbi:MAG: ATP-binding protein [Acidobacteria bacterium]|nr:ATP-binding protein [Acidobacteriota bacterium]
MAGQDQEPVTGLEPVQLVVDDATTDLEPPTPSSLDLIGHVVHWNRSPSFTEIAALLEPRSEVKPGQFLGVWHGRRGRNVLTVIQVGNSFEVNPNEVPDLAAAREALGLGRGYAGEGLSTRIFRLAECATIEEFDVREEAGSWQVVGEGGAPGILTRAGDPVVLLPPEITIQAIGGRPDPDSGVSLGETYGSSAVPVTLTPQIFQLHIGIFGNPGKGKSYLAGNLLEEAMRWGIPTLVLDINGEMIEAAKALKGLVLSLPDPKSFGISLNLMTAQELVAVTPNVQPNTIYAELIELAHDQLRNESRGRRITFENLKTRIAELGELSKAARTSIGTAIARVSVLERDPLVGGDFDFVKQLVQRRLVVLDCRFLSLRQTQLIAAAGARELQRIGREMARKAEAGDKGADNWFALYFVDEAHAVVPDDESVVSTQVHLELARMGRHVRTGLVVSSQSPQDLNVSVLKRLQMRFIFALEKDQLRSIQGVLADLDEKIVHQLPKLPRGVCAVSGSGELVRHGFLLRVRERVTPVGGRTPGVFEGRRKAPLTRG